MANKLISQLTPAAANLQDIDLIEAQVAGEVFSRKFTGAQIRAALMGNPVILHAGISADRTFTNIVPAGYMLSCIVFEEKSGNAPTLDLGTTAGGNEVFINQDLTASDYTTVVIQRVFSLTVATTLYLNDDTAPSQWNGATVDAYFVLIPVIPGGTITTGMTVVSYYEGAYGASNPLLQTEIDSIIGLATAYAAGSIFLIKDTVTLPAETAFIMSNGTAWEVNSATFTLAL
jgi:hypothetical protein